MTTNALMLKQFNDAFAKGDTHYIAEQVTDDIVWEMVGEFHLKGKEAFQNSLREMESVETLDMQILNTITQGRTAAVNGTMKIKEASGEVKSFGFCDVYEFNGFKNAKIKKMTSYVSPIKLQQPDKTLKR